MKRALAAMAWVAAFAAQPALAQDAMVKASDPAGMVKVLTDAGYTVTLDKDGVGDPRISIELAGFGSEIYFYECGEETHDQCRSIQFSAGFDRETPWTEKEALELARKYRFASVSLDDEGDPYVTWDVIIDDGIPEKVFLATVASFEETVNSAFEAVFPDKD